MKNYNHFHLILALFIFFIVYLFYKIIDFKVEQFRTDNFTDIIVEKNAETNARNIRKENTEKYIYTNAYRTQVAKATQNKVLPGEEIINVITQAEVDGNANLDPHEVYSEATKSAEDPTLRMTNPERWQYLFQHGIH